MTPRRKDSNHVVRDVTQNFDGSPMKEVLCVKCARGYKPSGNACVRCAGCACARNEVIVRDACVPRSFVNARQKYEGGLHPYALLDVVKYEYLCIHHNYRACRTLASECVKNFYTNEAAGPCRLWMQPNLVSHKGLPALLIESPNDKDPGIDLPRGENTLKLALGIHTSSGGFTLLRKPGDAITPCFTFLEITIGKDLSRDCHYNVSDMPLSAGDTLSPFLQMGGSFNPLPVALRKPNGSPVKVNK
ncbi:uncharacterized protein [Choristoneura fumiferana]|uniref:uncharacterized protein n=1 Tax=Choristoneura fumiferana TaxID=7141 RepID=UPI003D15E87B